jgi:predicted TIM-barrel fold metal-dependent hydrolase
VLVRFPHLRLAYSEGQIGWIPYVLERADTVWEEHRAWGGVRDTIPEPPSSYYYRQIYGCFFDDEHGLTPDSLEKCGPDNIMFETDYPHSDSTWPHSREAAAKQFGFLSQEVVNRIARGTAIELLGLPFSPDGSDN